MNLNTLLQPWLGNTAPDLEVSGLYNDSRKVTPGGLFLACKGSETDGRLYMDQAVSLGARAILYEPDNWPKSVTLPDNCLCFPLHDVQGKLAELASRFYDEPGKKLTMTGVTGTNGKTTIAWLLAQAHNELSTPAAYIGTLGYGSTASLHALANTTPDALCLQSLFSDFVKQGIQQVNMEVSSHALVQGRVKGIEFNQAIFSNLTLDHLDFHHTMDEYAAAKAMLFQESCLKWAIINHDDPYAARMQAATQAGCQVISYGMNDGSDVRALVWEADIHGVRMKVDSPWGKHSLFVPMPGYFNIYNALAVFTSLMVGGYDGQAVASVLEKVRSAPGRMDLVAQKPAVLVDYAHTPDALENVLNTLNQVKKGKLIVIFGCGGDRDKSKRPLMGDIATRCADIAIITNDNPRSEDPGQIALEIEEGIVGDRANVYKILDREQAIANALAMAAEDDIVLVAGKGHEAWQQIGSVKHPFSDHEVIRRLLSRVSL